MLFTYNLVNIRLSYTKMYSKKQAKNETIYNYINYLKCMTFYELIKFKTEDKNRDGILR